jgi:hypothetical protein
MRISPPRRRNAVRNVRFLLAAGFMVWALLAVSVLLRHAAHAEFEPAISPATQADAAEELAQKHAPIVYIRDQRESCDTRGSPYVPVPVEFVLEVEEIVLRRHQGGRTTDEGRAVTAADLYGKDETYFLDFPGNPKRPGCQFERDFLARAGDYTPTTYAHIAYEEGRDGFALQYWLFYYFNHWNNQHEGDWEMIQLTFAGPTLADALMQEPTGVGYSQHAGGERSDWGDEKLTKEGDRPVAFVAAGANANQFEPNVILGRGDNGTGFGCDDARKPSRRVALEAVLVEEPAAASDTFAWLTFDGRWGERAPWEFNGPTGPNDKRAWTEPFSWQEGLRPSSIIVPSGDIVGLNAVNLFCDVVWYASTPFALLVQLPPAVFAVGLLAGVGALAYAATRTQYSPIVAEPLRRSRHFGQIITAAARLYRQHVSLFLGIGSLFIPAGFVVAAIQWLLFQLGWEDTVSRFFEYDLAVKAAIALALGNLTAGVVYWFVTTATIAAVARIERQRANAVMGDYRDVFNKFAALAVPRLKALAIVTLLSITIVGIPWAIRNGYRWAFIEEAVLIDGASRRDATASSVRAVDGRWWNTFFRLATLGAVGFIAAPAVAFVLLFWSSLGVSVINLVAALVFVAITPFVAIGQALVYFDLAADADSPSEGRLGSADTR